ncbi:hypothetical protein [Sulfitobacter sp. SK011]|uniref:hypothetical protein n=1 Tax=Sulfitobacter sp. SK011 TaxID=1389004 RepID=UPI0013B36BD4|nr:hypothetical protein [Sulfitobacter sp. SK011]
MSRSLLAPLVLIGVLVGPASSQPLLEEPMAFNPYSETAMAITGPVILSTTKMVFETGKFINLEMLDSQAAGGWGASGDLPVAQVFRVLGSAGPLRRGNTLCGDQPVTYMAAWNENTSEFKLLGIAMFTGLDAPTGVAAQGICATYFFSMDALN